MPKVKVFCSGCTEHLGLLDLLRKVNPNVEFECLGYKEGCKKSKIEVKENIKFNEERKLAAIETTETCPINGKTGEALLQYACAFIDKLDKRGTHKGYIFADDLDDKPFPASMSREEIADKYWSLINDYDSNVYNRISQDNNIHNVVVLLAIPEIESWLLYDWDNGIRDHYNDQELVDALKSYLSSNEINGYWDNFEEWCSRIILGEYKKISEVLIESFEKIQLLDGVEHTQETMPHMNYLGIDSIRKRHEESRILSYSKKRDGHIILANINPKVLESKSRYIRLKFINIRAI